MARIRTFIAVELSKPIRDRAVALQAELARTGTEIKWTEPKLGFNGLIAVGGKLLVLTEMGELVLVEASPAGYKELGSSKVIEGRVFTAPSFANGRVYARNTKGDVVCLELMAARPTPRN